MASTLRDLITADATHATSYRIPHLDALAPDDAGLDRCTPLTRVLQLSKDPREYLAAIATEDLNTLDGHGASPLNVALLHCWTDAAEALLARGADPNRPDGNGVLPVDVVMGHPAGDAHVDVLKKAKVDAKRRFPGGRTFAHLAVERDATQAFGRLKKLGTPLDAVDDAGEAPLHRALRTRFCAAALVKAKASPDVRRADGETPLSIAAQWALSTRVASWRSEGETVGGKSAAYEIRDGVMSYSLAGKPKPIDRKNERLIANRFCPPHADFLLFLETCALFCATADLSLPTPDGGPIAQLLADLAHPDLAAVLAKRGVTLPPARSNPVANLSRIGPPPTPILLLSRG